MYTSDYTTQGNTDYTVNYPYAHIFHLSNTINVLDKIYKSQE